jgi:hypothetical protein
VKDAALEAEALSEQTGLDVSEAIVDEDEDEDEESSDDKVYKAVYEVFEIKDKRVLKGGEVEFFVLWRDYKRSEGTWEPREHLEGCEDKLEAFRRDEAGKRIAAARQEKVETTEHFGGDHAFDFDVNEHVWAAWAGDQRLYRATVLQRFPRAQTGEKDVYRVLYSVPKFTLLCSHARDVGCSLTFKRVYIPCFLHDITILSRVRTATMPGWKRIKLTAKKTRMMQNCGQTSWRRAGISGNLISQPRVPLSRSQRKLLHYEHRLAAVMKPSDMRRLTMRVRAEMMRSAR